MAGTFLAYSLLASTLLIVVWAVYKCVLANAGCFRFNRILLLSCTTLAFVFPIFILNPFWVADIMENNFEIAFNPVEIAYIANTVSEQITPIWDYIVTLYLIGVIVMTIYFLVSLVRLTLFILKGEHIKQDDCRIILHRHNSVAPFAWCGYIMMPRRDWYEFGQMIVCHEKAHIECRHWIDLLFMQAAIILTWYCPAIWLLRNELHTLHEYEADSRVLASGVKREEYQMFLIKKTVGARFATLSNCLNHSSLKKRITMMLSSKPTGKARVRAFVMVPAMALALIGLATPAVSAVINEVSAATPVEDLRYKISEKSDDSIRVTERYSDVAVTEKADGADAVPFSKTETAPNFPGGKDKLAEFVNKNISFPESAYVNGILDMDAVVQLTIA
ncbi:M56 family metallopeptidase, partial [Bacteroides caecimuris]|uniref:M56 family metallopeptidase n=1 Tax=Bacteroides caecimuris TaxID=1796613 RepID=UPI002649FB0E